MTEYKLSPKGHHWKWCGFCRTHMIICGTCGNNSCNAGYGYLDKECTIECPDCEECYKIQRNPTNAQLQALSEFYREMVDGFYDTHTSREFLIQEARKLGMVRKLKKLFKAIDEDGSMFSTVNGDDLDFWFSDKTKKILSESEKRNEEIEFAADNFHYTFRRVSKGMKRKILDGSKPKWEKSDKKYQEFIKLLVRSLRLV